MEGPPPRDPSTLDGGAPPPAAAPVPASPIRTASPSHRASASISNRHAIATHPVTVTSRQPGGHQLLSASHMNQPARSIAPPQTQSVAPAVSTQPAPPPPPQNDLFSLDFHAPSPTATSSAQPAQPKKDVKSDILSLFSSPAAPAATPAFTPQATASFASSPWGASQQQQPVAQQPGFAQTTSMVGSNGTGMWGVNSGWAAPAAPSQNNLWGNLGPAPAQTAFTANPLANTNNVWAGSAAPNAGGDLFSTPFASTTTNTQKKDDVFGDLWGGFK